MDREISFGKLIKEHRKILDLTQAELARRVGCATITLRKIEADSLRPSVQIAERLAMVLKIPLEERADFVRLARAASLKTPQPPPTPTPPPMPEEIGEQDLSGRAIRGYALGERIGTGGFGAVYWATQPVLEREVAIKIILPQYADHPDFIRRFEAEAQLVARLEHPHIVPLYDYWREPGAAYLVMRLLRGGSLQGVLKDGPVRLNNFMQMLEQICLALYAAHRIGVIHRDIKPANILLDEDENAYLADFGIAKNLGNPEMEEFTQIGAIVGSPAYTSPEQIRSEPVKPQADIYCLGVLVFEMLTGQQPFKGPTPVDYIQQHLSEPFPPLAQYNPDLPPALDPVILRATAKNPAERYPDVLSMLTDMQEVASGVLDVTAGVAILEASALEAADLENPYKGLRAFSEVDAADFFGRETLIQELLGHLGEQEDDLCRFLAVVGPSGSGKSSVVKAGLIPALRRGGLPGSESWFVVDFIPGAHPLEELEAALLRVAVNPPESLLGQLQESERGLLRAVQRILPPEDNVKLVLVVDQFEEVFTLVNDEPTRVHFLESLLTAVLEPRSRLRVVVTLRADFTDKPLQYMDFGELVRQRTEFVLPLTPDELELAITGPARRVGLVLEPGLVNRIIRDVGDQPGTLPMLQYALTELFEQRAGRRLTLSAYETSGGVIGTLGRRAEELYSGLDEAGQAACRQMFLRLVTLGEGSEDTRRRVARAELEALNSNQGIGDKGGDTVIGDQYSVISRVIDTFGAARLLSFDRDPVTRGPTVEVAHEALLREWRRLREWLDESRADIRIQQVLGNAASEWLQSERDPGFLLRDARLDQFEGWAASSDLALTQVEQDYLDASLEQRRARQAAEAERQAREAAMEQRSRNFLRALVVVLAVAAVLAVILSGVAFNQRGAAQANALLAERNAATATNAQGQALIEAATATAAQGQAEVQAALAATSEAEAQAQKAIVEEQALAAQRQAERNRSLALAAQSQIALQANKRDLALALAIAAVQIEDPPTQAQVALSEAAYAPGTVRRFSGHEDAVWASVLSTDGRTVLSAGDHSIREWDLQTGEQTRQVELDGNVPEWAEVGFNLADGQAAAGLDDSSLILLDLESGEILQRMTGHSGVVWHAAISPDGLTALSSSFEEEPTGDPDYSIRLWDLQTGTELRRFEGHNDFVTSIAFSPDGQSALSGSYDQNLILWDLETGEIIRRMVADEDVYTVIFNSNGRTALANAGPNLILWDLETGEEIQRLEGHNTGVVSFAFSPDEQMVVSGDLSGEIRVWDLATGEELERFNDHADVASTLFFSSNGDSFVSGSADTTLRLWDLKNGSEVRRFIDHEGGIRDIAYSPDGRTAISVEFDALHLWDLETGDEIRRIDLPAWGWEVAYTPDGHTALVTLFQEGGIIQVDLATGEQIQFLGEDENLDRHPGWVDAIAVLPDGKTALSGAQGTGIGDVLEERTLTMWDLESGEAIASFQTGAVFSVDISPDGRTALSGGDPSEESAPGLTLWDLESGEAIRQFEGHTSLVWDVAFNPDGKTALSGSWDTSLILWDLESGEIIHRLLGHSDMVRAVAISPDGKLAVSGSRDGTLILWDLESGEAIRRYSGHNGSVNSVIFSPDGGTVFSGAGDGVMIEWRVDGTLEELTAWTQANRYLYELSCAERAQYGVEPLCEGD